MAPKTRVKRKATAAAQAFANMRKKQRVSLESEESLPTGSETALSLIASPGVEETPAIDVASVTDSCPKTSQNMLGKFAEEWLETLDKEETKSVSLFLCYQLVHMFSFTETKAAEYAAAMVKKQCGDGGVDWSTMMEFFPNLSRDIINELVYFARMRN